MIVLWQGYHERTGKLRQLFTQALKGELLLILCPPLLSDFSFLSSLPAGEIITAGDWSGVKLPERSSHGFYPIKPTLGVFTSGSTEKPRLVLYSRENIESCSRAIFGLFDHTRLQKIFCYPQPFHTFGLTLGYAAAELFQKELVVPTGKYTRLHHEEWLSQVDANTLTLGTPTHFSDLVQFLDINHKIPPPSYSAIIGGARVPKQLWHTLQDRVKIEAPSIGYGATEASPGIAHLKPGLAPKEDGEVGHLLPQLKVSINAATGVHFSGPSLCTAILQDRKVNFPSEFILQDILEKRTDGILVHRGRLNFTLNRGGVKIFLDEVDRKIENHFGVKTVSCAIPHPRLGEELGLLLHVPPEKVNGLREAIFSFLRNEYGQNFNSDHLRSIESLPLNANLKVDRLAATKLWETL